MSVERKIYSREYKMEVLREHYEEGVSLYSLSKREGIPYGVIWKWSKSFLAEEKAVSLSPEIEESTEMKDYKSENEELKKRIKELEKEVKFKELQVLSRDMMIDIAEKEGIVIRKKSGAK